MRNQRRSWWKTGKFGPGLPLFALLILILILALFYRHGRDDDFIRADSYALNTHTEIIGVALGVLITVFILDARNRHRDEQRREQELKDRLLREARSPDPSTAQNAFHQMKEFGLIYGEDSILRAANLAHSRPGKVDLRYARMEGANLLEVDFSNANLLGANLEMANLAGSMLRYADLRAANLKNADLMSSDLTDALLSRADMSGANLLWADTKRTMLFVQYADPTGVFETQSYSRRQLTLPDGSEATKNMDLSRFSDPKHPELKLWRSGDPQSPAYRERSISRFLREFYESGATPPPAGDDPT